VQVGETALGSEVKSRRPGQRYLFNPRGGHGRPQTRQYRARELLRNEQRVLDAVRVRG
jgi:hypothetical protein